MSQTTTIIIIILAVALSIAVTALAFFNYYGDEISEAEAQKDLLMRLQEWEDRMHDQCAPGTSGRFCSIDETNIHIGQMKKDCVYAETSEYLAWCQYKGLR